ncbi:MAG: orotidine-5'-phosphate decarboxylase [Brockia lithotrophica]|nr:orotidine-5'-phosphate decarboxylase [Brockia lithotrophica]
MSPFTRKPFGDDPRSRLFVALDVASWSEAEEVLSRLGESVRRVKVGLELFFAEGPRVVETLAERGYEVFLDLKLHDIPNTVYRAARLLPAEGVLFLTVHASGGREMVRAAYEGIREALVRSERSRTTGSPGLPGDVPPYLLGVTWLTSLSETEFARLGIERERSAGVLAGEALAGGAAGLVASAREVASLRAALGPGPILVVPGIRPADPAFSPRDDDQRRVSTPEEAIRAGADAVVVGRPIVRASDPRKAAEAILGEIAAARSDFPPVR